MTVCAHRRAGLVVLDELALHSRQRVVQRLDKHVRLHEIARPLAPRIENLLLFHLLLRFYPCPPQAAGVANAATVTSIKLTSSFRMPILRAFLRTTRVGILSLDVSHAYHRKV